MIGKVKNNKKSLAIGKKSAKDAFKAYLERKMVENAKAIDFMLEMFDVSYDLIELSIEKDGVPGKGDIIAYFGGKAMAFSELSSDNRIACVKSAVTMVQDARTYLPVAETGVGLFAYAAVMIYDGLDTYQNCNLTYLDYKIAQQTEAFKKALEARARHHAQGKLEAKSGQTLEDQIALILDNQCRMPVTPPSTPSVSLQPL